MIEVIEEQERREEETTTATKCSCACKCAESLAGDDMVGPVGADKISDSTATYTGNEYDING